MRLLHVVGSARLESGGPIEGIRQRAAILKKMGHSVEVVTLDAPGASDLQDLGLTVHALGPTVTQYKYCSRLVPWLREHHADYDVLIVNGIWEYHGWGVRKVARQFNMPYFVFTHGMLDPWFNKTYPLKKLKKLPFWPSQHAVLRDAKAVLFTTEEERIAARESFRPYHVVERVVPYGTAAPPPPSAAQDKAIDELIPVAKDRRVILYLGRIHPKKGVDLLIQAFAKVFGDRPDWLLVVAGPDHIGWGVELAKEAAKLGIGERVVWPGMVRGDAKWGAYRKADAFILPSHQENFGISVAEALASGTPVLITDKVNIWREVKADEAGIVEPDTLEGVVKLLERLKAMSAEELETMGRRAAACFAAHFEVSRMATGLLEVIEELAHL